MSLIFGLAAICGFSIITGLPAVILGHIALRKIKKSPDIWSGKRVAYCGLVLGYLSIALFVTIMILANHK